MRISALLAALVLIGCKNTDDGVDGVDLDGDGYTTVDDCDDSNPEVRPGAVEICNEVDDDCDDTVDEGVSASYFRDGDGDGFGGDETLQACARPSGYTSLGGDCDDSDITAFPGNVELCDNVDHDCDGSLTDGAVGNVNFYADADGDGFGDVDTLERACSAPAGFVTDATDCDDAVDSVFPGAAEVCNSVDDDCNGLVDDDAADAQPFSYDTDGDGFGIVGPTVVACAVGQSVDIDGDLTPDAVTVGPALATDCNDANSAIFPGQPELCDNADNDCDPTTDEDLVGEDTLTWFIDSDGDGAVDPTQSVTACSQPAGYAPLDEPDCDDTDEQITPYGVELCDTIDNNCDGEIDEDTAVDATLYFQDFDLDGLGNPTGPRLPSCDGVTGFVLNDFDCNDSDDTIGAPPTQYADTDGDGYGDPAVTEIECAPAAGFVYNDEDCDDTNDTINPETVWFEDVDGDLFGSDETTQACEQPIGYAVETGDCEDGDPDVNPGALDLCNNADDDCDGEIDEDCIVEHCGLISADQVWAGDLIHVITCDIRVQGSGGPVLTIEDGAELRFEGDSQLRVGVNQPGALLVLGGSEGVLMRSANLTSPSRWGGLQIGPFPDTAVTSTLEGLTILDAGFDGYGVLVDEVELIADGLRIEGSDGAGIRLDEGATLDIVNSVIVDNNGPGILGTEDARLLQFSNNVLTGNQGEPLVIPATSVGLLDATSVFAPNAVATIGLLGGTITEDTTMSLLDADFRVEGDVFVQGGAGPELRVEDGVVVEFEAGTALNVGDTAQGSIQVDGAALGVLFTGAVANPGHWDGLKIGQNANDSALRNLEIAYGGGNARGNIWVIASAAVDADERSVMSLDGVTSRFSSFSGLYAERVKLDVFDSAFSDNLRHGAQVLDVVFSDSAIDGSSFTDNANSGVQISPQLVELLTGTPANTYAGNVFPLEIIAGTVNESATWQPLDEPFYVTGVVNVQNQDESVLTLLPGTEIFFGPTGRLRAGITLQGSLVVQGTPTNPVVFDTINAYQNLPTQRGSYAGLHLGPNQRTSRLDNLIVRHAGSTADGGIYVQGVHPNPVEFDEVTVELSGSDGVVVSQSTVWIHDSVVRDNDDVGIRMANTASLRNFGGGTRSFTDNVITGNALHAMELASNAAGQLDPSSTFVGNQLIIGLPDRIALSGDVTSTQSWAAQDAEYWVRDEVLVGASGTPVLTIEPGARLVFRAGTDDRLYVGIIGSNAGILAVGTPSAPIVFTSDEDHPGGDPNPGDWGGIELGPDCTAFNVSDERTCVLDHVQVDYAGSLTEEAAIMVATRRTIPDLDQVVIQNVRQRFSGSSGLQFQLERNIVNPTPTPALPFPVLELSPTEIEPFPMACEDLDLDGICDGSVFDYCYDAVGMTHGSTSLFCGNVESNVTARNFSNPFLWLNCTQAGLNDGPATCP